MADVALCAELQISNIETNKQFCRLAEKTQVAFPRHGAPEVIRNRLTHSYEVATSSAIMGFNIAQLKQWAPHSVDYQGSIKPCALLHDIGHPCLGHDGATYLNHYFQQQGLEEGFCDNNNTLVVIEKNNIMVSNYTACSVIKYPDQLYPDQITKYAPRLQQALKQDQLHFAKLGLELDTQTRTVACQIMDEADRNTYICSDLSDFLCLGNTLPIDALKDRADQQDLLYRYSELHTLFSMLRSGDKTAIKAYFNNLKNLFNMNYTLTSQGLAVINPDLHAYREFLWEIEHTYYICPLRQEPFHHNNMQKMREYVDKVVLQGFAPSRTYAQEIAAAHAKGDKFGVLRAQRNMIAETTDFYVTQIHLQAQSAMTLPTDNRLPAGIFAASEMQA